ncbi:ferrous iron transport protein B [Paucidesulfovibrio gracilis DSM 16080]|uniref:Ferrous iron transport protein B n=1 Tax=Paucidesulfovibrio gracilis DSM 16080 TaxID=1121449 RepID=A0A1T4WYJ3_9BACT|nr:ferrous iron transport protein B [Paucidesulfovibrio gracilis]SKA82453.1 ferrous iron transport protein B [Paucidesulfovibrio gracilis DSM 16080]
MSGKRVLVALSGQPNCGKSTIFNMLTGARQHVANYPGVTVEKKTGRYSVDKTEVELVDLPGTYSLTSYSLEERVARDFLLHDRPSVVVDVADASNLRRNLYLALQLLEMEIPMVLNLNMMDVAARREMSVDAEGLSERLGVRVVPTVGKKSQGGKELKRAVAEAAAEGNRPGFQVHYGPMEKELEQLRQLLAEDSGALATYPVRWLCVKLMEGDEEAARLLEKSHPDAAFIKGEVASLRKSFEAENKIAPERHIAFARQRLSAELHRQFVKNPEAKRCSLSDRADRFVCHRFWGPLILLAILLVLYEVAIVFGNWLALKAWPIWGSVEAFTAGILPASGFLEDPLLRSLGVWTVKSVTAILNYLPIFFLLFGLIAILEDSGYMPRMAFILDRLFRRFGLHGQSTLPLILGGVYVGGCAIPGVMATKAIPDERARLATILIVPMMNCLAKVPLYLLLIGAYFADQGGLAMFFIATVTLFMALPVAKILSMTVLRKRPSAPFIMEMPPYHVPTVGGVLRRAIERIWLFLKKIVTVVVAVAVVVFVLINFPGLPQDRMDHYQGEQAAAVEAFMRDVDKTSFAGKITAEQITPLILFQEGLRDAKRGVTDSEKADAINQSFAEANPVFYAVVKRQGKDGKKLNRSLKKLVRKRKKLRYDMRSELFEDSFLGMAGRALEPVTQYAGFNWRINIALLSAFAAKENSAATLGAIYGIDGTEASVQDSMKRAEGGFTPLHALALMLFMALYPPCVPASIMVRMQANSTKWMLFSIAYQTLLGLGVASLVFTGGRLLGLTGFQTMWAFYGLCVAVTIIMALIPERESAADSTNTTPLPKGECPEGAQS